MNRFTILVAAVGAALSSIATSIPAAAQPRGRSQANTASSRAQADTASAPDDDVDGPEVRGVAAIKLDEVIKAAVRLSPDLARATTEREAARAAAGAAGRDQQWVLSAEANYQRDALGADTPDNRLEPLTPLATDKVTGTLSLGRNLPTGGNLKFDLGLSHIRQEILLPQESLVGQQGAPQAPQSECGESPDIFCQDQATARVTFTQPLARNLGSDVALASQHKADLGAAEATVKAQFAAEQMLRDIIIAYWELAYAAYEVDVRADSLDLARKQEQLTLQEIRITNAAPNAVDAVRVEIQGRDDALLVSKLTFEEKSLDLRRKAGLEIGRRDIAIRPADPLELDRQDWNIDEVLAQSHKINRQIASIVLEKRIADVDVDVAHNALLPKVDLTLSGAVLGTGDTTGAAFAGLGGDSNNGFGYQVVAGLSLSFELSGAAKSAHAAAVAKRHLLDIQRVDVERQIDAQIVAAVKKLQSGRTRVALAEKAIAIAEENVKAERAQFMMKQSTNFQVMQRQTQLMEARLRRGRAVTDYRTAAAQLQFLSGTLLDSYRIHVRRADREE